MGTQVRGMGEKRYGGGRGDTDSVGMGSEQSWGWVAPGAAEGRGGREKIPCFVPVCKKLVISAKAEGT